MEPSNFGDLDNPETWKNFGNDYFSQGKYEEAIKSYAHAIELDTNYLDAWNNMGLALLKLGKIDEAKQVNEHIKKIKSEILKPIPQTIEEPAHVPQQIQNHMPVKIDKRPFWLCLIALIFGILAGLFAIFFGGLLSVFGESNAIISQGIVAILFSIVGFAGAIINRNRIGSILMILGGVMVLFTVGAFGILTFILFLLAGIIEYSNQSARLHTSGVKKIAFLLVIFLGVFIVSIVFVGLAFNSLSSATNSNIPAYNSNQPSLLSDTPVSPIQSSSQSTNVPISSVNSNQFNSVTHSDVSTILKNWDEDAEDDGISIHPSLFDSNDNEIYWSGETLPVDLEIWTTKYDSNFKSQKDKLVYSGSGTISSWRDGNMFMNGCIRVPFSSMNVPPGETVGSTYAKVHLPDGRTIESVYIFTSLTP